MDDLFDLSGQTALITGSTKGIGKAIAARMAQYGAKVVVSSRKSDVCDAVAEEINRAYADRGGKAIAIPCHVGHKEQF
jgi:NAD(P)-dependent dehydrogenase (short-subunit alcohol dehydrogenase family)